MIGKRRNVERDAHEGLVTTAKEILQYVKESDLNEDPKEAYAVYIANEMAKIEDKSTVAIVKLEIQKVFTNAALGVYSTPSFQGRACVEEMRSYDERRQSRHEGHQLHSVYAAQAVDMQPDDWYDGAGAGHWRRHDGHDISSQSIMGGNSGVLTGSSRSHQISTSTGQVDDWWKSYTKL